MYCPIESHFRKLPVAVHKTYRMEKLIRLMVVSTISDQIIAESPAGADPHPQAVILLCACIHGEIELTGDYSMLGFLGALSARMYRCIVRQLAHHPI